MSKEYCEICKQRLYCPIELVLEVTKHMRGCGLIQKVQEKLGHHHCYCVRENKEWIRLI